MMISRDEPRKKRPGRKGAVGELLPMLTEDSLRDLLRRDVLRGGVRVPAKDSLECLAEKLYFFRFRASSIARQVLDGPRRDQKDIVGVAEEIVRLSQSILDQFDMNIAFKEGQLSAFPNGELKDQVNRARFAINEMQINKAMFVDMKHACEMLIKTDCFGLLHSKTTPVYTWHDIACELAFDFQVALHPNNPTMQMGLSNTGPMQRFIAAVVPHTTGERPNVEQAGKFLKDHPPRLLHLENRDDPDRLFSPGNIRS